MNEDSSERKAHREKVERGELCMFCGSPNLIWDVDGSYSCLTCFAGPVDVGIAEEVQACFGGPVDVASAKEAQEGVEW